MSEIEEMEENKAGTGNGAGTEEVQPEAITVSVEGEIQQEEPQPSTTRPKNEIVEITEEAPAQTEEEIAKKEKAKKLTVEPPSSNARPIAASPTGKSPSAAPKRTGSLRPGPLGGSTAQPGPADLKLLQAANVPVEKFAPFTEIQWISNLSEGAVSAQLVFWVACCSAAGGGVRSRY